MDELPFQVGRFIPIYIFTCCVLQSLFEDQSLWNKANYLEFYLDVDYMRRASQVSRSGKHAFLDDYYHFAR